MLTTEMKNTVDAICAISELMVQSGVNPLCTMASAFSTAKEFLNDGDVDAALYLLEKHKDYSTAIEATVKTMEALSMFENLFGEDEG